MIFPIGDDNSDRIRTPYVNYLFIAVNIFVFVVLQGMGTNAEFTYSFSTVPQEIVTGQDVQTEDRVLRDPISGNPFRAPGLQPTPVPVYLTLLSGIFMHGGFMHLFGNMLYLWIFGDNVESRLGHMRYVLFYLLGGLLASLAHVFATYAFDGNPLVPSLGASGAISAVLGAYILLFPHRRVRVIMLRILTTVPAIVAIGIWFAFQLMSGLGMLGGGSQEGGVAYGAHIGGFIAGVVLIKLFDPGPETARSGAANLSRRSW
jgi:membrane associated rhomboid family serine protease